MLPLPKFFNSYGITSNPYITWAQIETTFAFFKSYSTAHITLLKEVDRKGGLDYLQVFEIFSSLPTFFEPG
ncbi:hypothetical protein ES703_18525 [subsurface metagenome]